MMTTIAKPFAAIALLLVIAGQIRADEIRIGHDGIMRTSIRDMSVHGVGVSRIETDEFVLSVRGQFRLVNSARVTLRGDDLGKGRPKTTPVWVSLVALGEIELELPGIGGKPPSLHRARTAVYRVKEDRWILDSEELKK